MLSPRRVQELFWPLRCCSRRPWDGSGGGCLTRVGHWPAGAGWSSSKRRRPWLDGHCLDTSHGNRRGGLPHMLLHVISFWWIIDADCPGYGCVGGCSPQCPERLTTTAVGSLEPAVRDAGFASTDDRVRGCAYAARALGGGQHHSGRGQYDFRCPGSRPRAGSTGVPLAAETKGCRR
jgi:hypothetical protein